MNVAPTIDAVQAQQRFLVYAAHELRGEISLQLTLAEATLADPNADTAALREMGEGVVAACWRQERLLEALLDARPERVRTSAARARRPGRDRRRSAAEPTIITASGAPWRSSPPEPPATRSWSSASSPTWSRTPSATTFRAAGSTSLTYSAAGRATFTIANTGPVIPAGEIQRLFQPFHRHNSHACSATDGVGLGLAIVQAIADAHEATLTAQARSAGGLGIDVSFPALD